MADVDDWIIAEVQEQKKFVFGFACLLSAVALKWLGIIKISDAPAVSKVAFNLMMPPLLFAGIYKIELSAELVSIALASMCFHVILIPFVLCLARRQPLRDGIRGQWILCAQGVNAGIAYPFFLTSDVLRQTVFPKFVAWDLGGNAACGMIVNLIVAMTMAPSTQAEDDASSPTGAPLVELEKEAGAQAQPDSESGLEAVIGSASYTLENTEAAASRDERAIVRAMAMDGCDSRRVSAILDSKGKTDNGTTSRFLPRMADVQERLTVASAVGRRIAKNLPFLGQCLGILCKVTGIKVPSLAIDFLETVSAPFGLLLFFVIGLNLEFSLIRPHIGRVLKILPTRYAIYAVLGGLFALLPPFSDKASMQTLVFACICPVSGITMSYVLDFGYNASMQAAILVVSNILSFMTLWALISLYS
eukprot:TRINITY_DN17854_c1_g1_i1.p1 TRINITY_DN17854_c1_g1~~TRINITY_DN17854_c1_g1_i1.p1  ORF type:complete len:418 (+),score=72.69 TRINITY_DN17854_c1_g1_i1:112-1365(+)